MHYCLTNVLCVFFNTKRCLIQLTGLLLLFLFLTNVNLAIKLKLKDAVFLPHDKYFNKPENILFMSAALT